MCHATLAQATSHERMSSPKNENHYLLTLKQIKNHWKHFWRVLAQLASRNPSPPEAQRSQVDLKRLYSQPQLTVELLYPRQAWCMLTLLAWSLH